MTRDSQNYSLRRYQAWFRRQKHALLALQLLASALLVTNFTGCSAMTGFSNSWSYNSSWNEMVSGYRNRAWAQRAWHARKHHFCNEKHNHDFAQGFKDGYAMVADGGDGCTPAFPPRKYWSWMYQSPEGQQKVAAWYAGYPHGARAAEEDGVGYFTQIQTSTTIQEEYAQVGRLPQDQVGMYPIAAPDPYALPAPVNQQHQPLPGHGIIAPQDGPIVEQIIDETIIP